MVHDENKELVDEYLSDLANIEKAKPTTIRTYRSVLNTMVRWVDDIPLPEMGWELLSDFIYRPRRVKGGGSTKPPENNTVRRETAILRSFWGWMILSNKTVVDKKIMRMKADAPALEDPHPMPDSLWMPLWRSLKEKDDKVAFGFMYFIGLRKAEWASILVPEVIPSTRKMDFTRKGKWEVRHKLDYGDVIETWLRPHLPHIGPFDEWLELVEWLVTVREGEMFLAKRTEPMTTQASRHRKVIEPTSASLTYWNKHLHALLNQAGLTHEDSRVMTPHALRHAAATNLYRSGAPLLTMATTLNHSDIKMTRKYAEVAPEHTAYRMKVLRELGLRDDF